MDYLMFLVRSKENAPDRNLAAKVLRDFSKPAGTNGATGKSKWEALPAWAKRFRGGVVASRILAISTPPHCRENDEHLVSEKGQPVGPCRQHFSLRYSCC